jgi:hypothetical protein
VRDRALLHVGFAGGLAAERDQFRGDPKTEQITLSEIQADRQTALQLPNCTKNIA